MGRVEVALHRLHPVAGRHLLGRHELGWVMPLGAEVPERRHRLPGAQVGPDDPAGLVGGVRPHPHLVAERLRLARHVDAPPVGVERPPVVNAAQGGALVAPEVQRRAAVRAVLLQQPDPPGAVPVGDQVLAEQPDPDRRASRLGNLRRQAGWRPVAAEQLAHQRPRTHPGQDLVLFRPQHAAPPPDPDQLDPRPLSNGVIAVTRLSIGKQPKTPASVCANIWRPFDHVPAPSLAAFDGARRAQQSRPRSVRNEGFDLPLASSAPAPARVRACSNLAGSRRCRRRWP